MKVMIGMKGGEQAEQAEQTENQTSVYTMCSKITKNLSGRHKGYHPNHHLWDMLNATANTKHQAQGITMITLDT